MCIRLSGPLPVASQMGVCEEDYHCKPALPTHAVSKTYIHKTHFSIPSNPRPPLCLMLPGNKLGFYLNCETQSSKFGDSDSGVEAGLTWSPYVYLLHFHPPLLIKCHCKHLEKVFCVFLNSHYQDNTKNKRQICIEHAATAFEVHQFWAICRCMQCFSPHCRKLEKKMKIP